MYVKDLLNGLRRRWYLALLGLLATLGLGVAAVGLVPVTYTSTTSILLLPPSTVLGSRGNPYLYLSGLDQALDVLAARVDASDASQNLLTAHPRVTGLVDRDTTTTGPILLITSTSPSPAESIFVRDQLAALVPSVLKTMQDELGVRTPSQITTTVLAKDRLPEREIKDQLRAIIVVVAVGGTVTVLGTGYLDVALEVRSGRRVRRRRTGAVASWDWWGPAATGEQEAPAHDRASPEVRPTAPPRVNGSTPGSTLVTSAAGRLGDVDDG